MVGVIFQLAIVSRLFSGNQRFSGEFEVHLVSGTGDLRPRTIWKTASPQGDVRSQDQEKSNNPLRAGVTHFYHNKLILGANKIRFVTVQLPN